MGRPLRLAGFAPRVSHADPPGDAGMAGVSPRDPGDDPFFTARPRGWVVALVPLMLLLPTGSLALAQERFMVPAIGSLVVASAYAVVRLVSWWRERAPSWTPAAPPPSLGAALLLICLAWPAPAYVQTPEMLRRPATPRLAP